GRRTAGASSFGRRSAAPVTARAAAGTAASRGWAYGDRFRFAAQHEQDPSLGIEFDHVARSLIDHPDVVLRIDLHRLREVEAVDALADLAHELTGLIELEQARAALVERARAADGRVRSAGSRVDVDVPFGIGGDA